MELIIFLLLVIVGLPFLIIQVQHGNRERERKNKQAQQLHAEEAYRQARVRERLEQQKIDRYLNGSTEQDDKPQEPEEPYELRVLRLRRQGYNDAQIIYIAGESGVSTKAIEKLIERMDARTSRNLIHLGKKECPKF